MSKSLKIRFAMIIVFMLILSSCGRDNVEI